MGETNHLKTEMQQEHRKWATSTKVYGTANVSIRLFLIIVSSIFAAEKSLGESAISAIKSWIPILAVAVGVLTAIDTWLKPREKWKGFMKDRDDLSALIREMNESPDKKIEIGNKFDELRNRHRETNVY